MFDDSHVREVSSDVLAVQRYHSACCVHIPIGGNTKYIKFITYTLDDSFKQLVKYIFSCLKSVSSLHMQSVKLTTGRGLVRLGAACHREMDGPGISGHVHQPNTHAFNQRAFRYMALWISKQGFLLWETLDYKFWSCMYIVQSPVLARAAKEKIHMSITRGGDKNIRK